MKQQSEMDLTIAPIALVDRLGDEEGRMKNALYKS
jgi:hypothetical protein